MKIGNRKFDTENNVYIMGILNVTPDSFSDGGKYNSLDSALYQAERMIEEGADIIDIGGESTRPGHEKISVGEEIDRVAPVIEAVGERFSIPISLDSYKSRVARAVIGNIDLINDIWGLRYDSKMARLIAESGLPCCLMHNRKEDDYIDFWDDFLEDMSETLKIAQRAGIAKENIILDGGVGFKKSYEQNLAVINRTEELCSLGYPVMLATSRKSVIGQTLDKPSDQRIFGTAATTAAGVMKGASFVRVHDVGANLDVIRMTKTILGEKRWTK